MNEKIFQDPQEWWNEYSKLNKKEKLLFVEKTLDAEADENFWKELDFFKAVNENFWSLLNQNKLEEAVKFLENIRLKRPDLYNMDFPFYDRNLIKYYASIGNHQRIKELITNFLDNPTKNVDLFFDVLDTLILYGYTEEVKKLVDLNIVNKIRKDRNILPSATVELEGITIFSFIADHLTSGIKANDEKFINRLVKLGLDINKKSIKAALEILRGKARKWDRNDFLASNEKFWDNAFLMSLEFAYYLHTKHELEWIMAELFRVIVREYLSELSPSKDGFMLYFSEKCLNDVLAAHMGLISVMESRGYAFLPAIIYYSNFLYEKNLITKDELEEFKKGFEEFKEKLRQRCQSAGWKYKFLTQFKLDGKPLFEEDYFEFKSHTRNETTSVATHKKKVGRNEPCPCGSGKKYKKCCGSLV